MISVTFAPGSPRYAPGARCSSREKGTGVFCCGWSLAMRDTHPFLGPPDPPEADRGNCRFPIYDPASSCGLRRTSFRFRINDPASSRGLRRTSLRLSTADCGMSSDCGSRNADCSDFGLRISDFGLLALSLPKGGFEPRCIGTKTRARPGTWHLALGTRQRSQPPGTSNGRIPAMAMAGRGGNTLNPDGSGRRRCKRPKYPKRPDAPKAPNAPKSWPDEVSGAGVARTGAEGSWPGGRGGSCYSTAMGAPAMAVSYRQLPIYQR